MTDDAEPRRAAPDDRPVALTIAGSDSGGGAGVQADLETMAACGVFGTSAVTAVTAQHTRGVESTHVLPVREVAEQIEAVRSDFDVGAVKTGMLATAPVIGTVSRNLGDEDAPVVVDPVMVAASGDRLLDADAEAAYGDLIAGARLVTPNVDEAAVLTDVTIEGVDTAVEAGRRLVETGAAAALVTGGHVDGPTVRDVLVVDSDRVTPPDEDADRPADVRVYEHPRVDTAAGHGSGCALSSAVAARLARGDTLDDAVERATDLVARAVRYHYDVGEGPGAVHPLAGLRERAARDPTAEAVRMTVDAVVDRGVAPLVPEVGMNVVGATPYAERPGETAAVEGRITRTPSGVAARNGVRFGVSSHVARFLIAAREHDPSLRFAVNCRHDDAVAAALDDGALDGPVGRYDRTEQPAAVRESEGRTMAWGAERAFDSADGTPVAVRDPGAHGKEPMVKLLAADTAALRERATALLDAVA
jgi:hydroxymethylpyrimidine/phosphomethylpyrimidine kinase